MSCQWSDRDQRLGAREQNKPAKNFRMPAAFASLRPRARHGELPRDGRVDMELLNCLPGSIKEN